MRVRRPGLLLLSLSFLLGLAGVSMAADPSEISLISEIQELRQTLAEKEAKLASLKSSQGQAFAMPSERPAAISRKAPSSTLSKDKARLAASAARFMVSGSSLMTVMPTGSMKPMFDENAVLMIEPANFDELKVGDVITYLHPVHNKTVVHRIVEKRGDQYLTQGDNNGRRDDVSITRENYQGRVFGMVFAKEAAN